MSSGEDPSVLARADPTHHHGATTSLYLPRLRSPEATPGRPGQEKQNLSHQRELRGFGGREKKKSMPRGAVSESSKLRKCRANAQGSASPRLRTRPVSRRDSGNGTANRGQTRSPTPGGLTCERDQRGPKPSTNRGLTGIPGGPRKVWQVAKDGTHLMFG